MGHTQTYEGTFAEITRQYGKELADRRVKVIVEEAETHSKELEAKEKRAQFFYETATREEWIAAVEEWGNSQPSRGGLLSDEAMDRDSIYEGRG